MLTEYDVAIIGAGPAGCACALALKDAGLKVGLIDKSGFPRDKVCGDAIPGRAIKTLRHIEPEFEKAFQAFGQKSSTSKTDVHYGKRSITFNWVGNAYTCARWEFDNFLFSLVKDNTATFLHTDAEPANFNTDASGISFEMRNGDDSLVKTKMLIGADGAHSVVSRHFAPRPMNRDHYVGSVRAYYSGISDLQNDTTEIFFNKGYLPSYLWVFPLPDGKANVGFGMLSSTIARRGINLKDAFYDFINGDAGLSNRFRGAVQLGELQGFGLPLGSNVGKISGERFLLTGDAASLIDPITGDGIGNAMLSGRLAAEQVIRCFKQNDFSAPFTKTYRGQLMQAIGAELHLHYKGQRTISRFPFLLDILFPAAQNKIVSSLLKRMM